MYSIVRSLLALASFAAILDARPSPHGHILHEKRDGPAQAWLRRDRLRPDAVLPMKIGLKQENLDKGYDYLMDVSDPESPNFGKHWTEEEVHAAFEPHSTTIESVRQWLSDAGIGLERIMHSENRGWLHFHATAAEAESLLKTELYEHEHVSKGKWSVGCDEYHLPQSVREHIDYVTPGVKMSQLRRRTVSRRSNLGRRSGSRGPLKGSIEPLKIPLWPKPPSSGDLANCSKVVTPACIAALYQIPEPAKSVHPGNALGIFEEGDVYAQEDLDLFFANFTPRIPKGTHPTLKSIDGGQAPVPVDQAGGESDLDFQLAYPIVYPQEIVLYQVDDVPQSQDGQVRNNFLDALDGSYCNYTAFGETGDDPVYDPTYPDPAPGGYKGPRACGTYKPTKVISISYGDQEVDFPVNYQKRQCNEWMKFGLQGISVFIASGDNGVEGPPEDTTAQNVTAANGCLGKAGKVFNPAEPNSCPYVTNVGATMVRPNGTVYQPESAAYGFFSNGTVLFTSGGGFSNIFPTADYQKAAVGSYFAKYNPPYPSYSLTDGFTEAKAGNGIYNRIGRGYPDVSAVGLYLGIYNQGEYARFGGTSASTPIFASIVNRINDARLNIGKGTIGFINPALYKNPWVLNDITNGTNPGCGTTGFKAVPGWDPVTGLGTPNFPRMKAFFLALP